MAAITGYEVLRLERDDADANNDADDGAGDGACDGAADDGVDNDDEDNDACLSGCGRGEREIHSLQTQAICPWLGQINANNYHYHLYGIPCNFHHLHLHLFPLLYDDNGVHLVSSLPH